MAPDRLMTWLSSLPALRETCAECGAGGAEIAAFLAGRFDRCYALDITPIPRSPAAAVNAVQADAGALPFKDGSIDLVVSMQALHHFDVLRHLREARRVLRHGGVFAALCWGDIVLPRRIARAYGPVFRTIRPYWEAEREGVLSGYRGLRFDGRPVRLPPSAMKRRMTLAGLDRRMATWSAVQAALRAGIALPEPDLGACGVAENETFPVSWPILGQVYRVDVA